MVLKPVNETLGAASAEPGGKCMFLMIADERVYVFREKKGRDAAANYLSAYRGISDLRFAEAIAPKDVAANRRKARGYIKTHWRECVIGEPVPVKTLLCAVPFLP